MEHNNFYQIKAQNKYNIVFSIVSLFVIIFSIFIISCQKEVNMPESQKPTTADQLFSIDENPNSNAIVGRVSAINNDSIYKSAYINKFKSITNVYNNLLISNKLRFSILSGNDNNAFKIDSINGIIIVNDSSVINYEVNNDYKLQVRIYDFTNQSLSDTSLVEIAINDIKAPTDGLVSYFPFSQTLTNTISGKNGKGKNIGYFTDRKFKINEACDFVGYQSYVTLDSAYDFPTRTISLWFNIVDTGSNQQIIYSSDNGSLKNPITVFSVVNNAGTIYLQLQAGNVVQKVTANIDTWYHAVIVVVSQTNQAIFYVNGKLVGTKSIASNQVTPGGYKYATLGVNRNLNNNFFSGRIDDLYIYNRVLTEKEIRILFLE